LVAAIAVTIPARRTRGALVTAPVLPLGPLLALATFLSGFVGALLALRATLAAMMTAAASMFAA
jgi:hypothetical protein